VTSPSGSRVMRVEARPNISSALAGKLTKLGYRVAICGVATRIVPNAVTENSKDLSGRKVTHSAAGIVDVDVLEIMPPGK